MKLFSKYICYLRLAKIPCKPSEFFSDNKLPLLAELLLEEECINVAASAHASIKWLQHCILQHKRLVVNVF